MNIHGITQPQVPSFIASEQERENAELLRIEELRLASGGLRVVGPDDRMPKALENLEPELQELVRDAVASKSLAVFDASDGLLREHSQQHGVKDASKEEEEDMIAAAVKSGERVTQRRANLTVLNTLLPAG